MAYIPSSGSVVAFQSDPAKLVGDVSVVSMVPHSVSGVGTFNTNNVGNGSIITVPQGSIGAVIIGGSVAVATGNSSVQVVGQMPPQSVSGVGTFNINPVGNGSIIGTLINSSVATLQGTNPWIVQLTSGSIATSGGTTGNSSVMLTPGINTIGSVAVLQGTNPWQVNMPSPSVIAYQLAGSVMAVAATVNTGNSSVMLTPGINTIGSVATLQGTNPWVVQLTSGSIATSGGTTGNSSVLIVGQMPPQSVSGVGLFNVNHTGNGSVITVIASGNTSVQGTMSVLGTVPVTQATTPWTVQLTSGSIATSGGTTGNSSVLIVGQMPAQSVSGVGLFNVNHTGNGSVITVPQPGSVSGVGLFNVNHTGNGSIITVFANPSIVGTYSEDAAHTTADKGLFVLQVRNDTMSSITSADGDYSPQAVGPVGEVLTANSPITKWISGQNSVMYGTSVQVVAPQGASVFTYITGIQIANNSATASLVKFTGGLGSVLGWTIAPATGGSNIVFPNALKTGENSGVSASISGISSVYLTMEGFISKI